MKIGEVYVSCIMTDWMLVDVGTGCILSCRVFFFLGGGVRIDSPTVDNPTLMFNFEEKKLKLNSLCCFNHVVQYLYHCFLR